MRSGCPIFRARGSCIKLSSIPDRSGIYKCWFLRRGENRSTRRKTSQSREENQQQTQPTYDVESGNRTHIGGRRVLSPLRHPLSLPSREWPLSKSSQSHSWNYKRQCWLPDYKSQLRKSVVSSLKRLSYVRIVP